MCSTADGADGLQGHLAGSLDGPFVGYIGSIAPDLAHAKPLGAAFSDLLRERCLQMNDAGIDLLGWMEKIPSMLRNGFTENLKFGKAAVVAAMDMPKMTYLGVDQIARLKTIKRFIDGRTACHLLHQGILTDA